MMPLRQRGYVATSARRLKRSSSAVPEIDRRCIAKNKAASKRFKPTSHSLRSFGCKLRCALFAPHSFNASAQNAAFAEAKKEVTS
jgi:hypothetical protein